MVIKEIQEEVDWVDYMDAEAMGAMLKEEGDVLAVIIEEPSDPSTFIMLANRQLSYWSGITATGSLTRRGETSPMRARICMT